ncbi:MAG: sugar phosphate isomerase/epimerase, partial [Firmicutes bacterium]|nr:sugar phosphate isomerase/epimerase [Bacillota bacterium]
VGSVLDDLWEAEPFRHEKIAATKAELAARRLTICSLETSVSFSNPETRLKMLALGRSQLELAAELGVKRIRVFGDKVPPGQHKEEVMQRIAEGLRELATFADPLEIDVLLETHGHFCRGREVRRIVEMAAHPRVGVVWDVHHSFRADETPAETYGELKDYLRSIHFKDSKTKTSATSHIYCLLGQGEVPIRECLRLLKKGGYTGWIVFEWEKRWHPEIDDPEIAFPHFIREIRRYLADL